MSELRIKTEAETVRTIPKPPATAAAIAASLESNFNQKIFPLNDGLPKQPNGTLTSFKSKPIEEDHTERL